jgi:hypothetical protein
MTLQGTIKNGVVELDQPSPFPDGTRVVVEPVHEEEAAASLRDILLKFAGCMRDLPADLAAQHDHYLHGTPKR